MIQLNNDLLSISIKEKGAELCSLVDLETKVEHIWQADPVVWGRHAPVLFPIVGQVENNLYDVDGITYQLTQHGFARDRVFSLIQHSETLAKFELVWDQETLSKYPYQFKLFITYELRDNELIVRYEVLNEDQQEIYFSIGAHPGFSCPFYESENIEDYHLEFNELLKGVVEKIGMK